MVKFITYKNKKYPVRISYYALKKLNIKFDKELENVDMGTLSFEAQEYLLFFALESGAKALEQEFGFTINQMEDILDECWGEFLKLVPEFFPKVEDKKKPDFPEGQPG